MRLLEVIVSVLCEYAAAAAASKFLKDKLLSGDISIN